MDKHFTDLIPAYALDSLDQGDRIDVEKHLLKCEICIAELRTYREVVGELAYAITPADPPESLKMEIMNKIDAADDKATDQTDNSWWQRFINFYRNASPVWAVAGILLIIFLGASNIFLISQLSPLNKHPEPANLPVINLYGTDMKPDATGVLVVSADGEHGTLIVDRLPVLDESKQYQLWLVMDGTRVSGGVFSVSKAGYGSLWVDSDQKLSSYNTFGITIEPFGGSPGPTGEKILGSEEIISFDL